MKKLINMKEIMIIVLSVALVTVATSVFASDIVLGTNSQDTTQVDANEYALVQNDENETNATNNLNNNSETNIQVNNNTAKTYNTANNNSKSNLPQTGIEDYNVGILLVIAIASAIFAYKKVQDYKNI